MRNCNQENIEGRIYEHNLTIKTVSNQQSENFGKEFINGTLSVATDEAGLQVLTVHYTYVTELTKNGSKNATYGNLKKIIETGKTWITDGKDEATKVKLSTSAALNDFYPQGGDQLVSQQRNEGGFVSIVNDLNPNESLRRKFTFDTVITGAALIEADPEKGTDEYVKINAAIFNFKNDILPFTLVARGKGAMDYFLSLDASPSNPVFTNVWGEIVNTTVKIEKTIESAFGEPVVDVTTRSQREWVITGAKPETYEFGVDITAEELSKALADRNVYLETVKTRAKEYYANKASSATAGFSMNAPTGGPVASAQIPQGGFNF